MGHDTHPIVFAMIGYVAIIVLLAGALYVLVT